VRRIGITGGIGSGKSRVAAYWADKFDLSLINLDLLCQDLLQQNQPGWQALQQRFGDSFFHSDGSLDRPGLRNALFSRPDLRSEVDSLLHPLARQCMHDQIDQATGEVVLIEIPLLFEAGWQHDVDRIVLVYADEETRVRRLVNRDEIREAEAVRALSAQWDLSEKIFSAHHVVDNSGAWISTCLQILHLARLYART